MVSGCSYIVADPEAGLSDLGASGLTLSPVVVRLAGLAVQAIEPLASPSCVALLQVRETLERELGEARQTMVDAIGGALPGFDAPVRRFLLNVKRSCFNGREIGFCLGQAEWASLQRVAPGLAERIATLEEQLRENDRAFAALYESELDRERRHLLGLIRDRRFLRGVALGRPGLVEKVRSQAPSFAGPETLRRPAKWELSLLRFVTRAATKLSANSTLTAYALGNVEAGSTPGGFRFGDLPRREISLVRVNRPELEQFQALLMRHPAVRERALVAWNDSVEEIEPGHYRFLRGGHWTLEPGAEGFQFVPPARVTVELLNPLLGPVREALRADALAYGTVLTLLEDQVGTLERSAFDQLVDIGLLVLLPPWPANETHLERRIRQFLQALPGDVGLRATAEALDELVALEEGFASSPRPESSVDRLEDAFARLLDTVVHLAGHKGSLATRAHFFEDVLLAPAAPSGGDPGIFRIAESTVGQILQNANLVSRFAGLYNHRHDVLHTLAAWWRYHEPGRREAPFTEIARRFALLWKEFIQFHKTADDSALNTFDPLHVPALQALRERRETLLAQYRELLSLSPAKDVLPPQQLGQLLEDLPSRYAPLLGTCVFVQPVDAEGSSWVLNRISEGTGRYLSRVTPVLEGHPRQRFLAQLPRCP